MATDTPFMMSIISGIMNVMTRFVNSCVRMSRVEASSKRASSNSSRSNARMTGRPVSISRATRFTRSMSFCIILNLGMATFMSTPMSAKMMTTATTMIQPMAAFVRVTMMMPPMARMGEYSTMRSSMTVTIWMSWMSLVPRVMSEAAEKRPISFSEKATTRPNSFVRSVRPTLAAVREAMNPTATATAMPKAASPSMSAPVRRRKPICMSERL